MSVVKEMLFEQDMKSIYKKFGMSSKIDYRNKVILGPMVSVSVLSTRLISLMYGADLVFGEELIDHLVLKTFRTFNESTGIIQFRQTKKDSRHAVVFSTFENEPVIFQMGTSDPVRALKAAEIVANDVKGIDINMGCPVKFSVAGGMGAALLKKPELVSEIIKTLKRNLNLPVSCKIRILEDEKKSIELVKILESAGANVLN